MRGGTRHRAAQRAKKRKGKRKEGPKGITPKAEKGGLERQSHFMRRRKADGGKAGSVVEMGLVGVCGGKGKRERGGGRGGDLWGFPEC